MNVMIMNVAVAVTAVCDIMRGRFAIHCFGTMLKVESLEKCLGLGLARSRSRLVAKIRRLGLVEL